MKKIGNIGKTYNLFLRVWLLIIPVCLWTGREIYGQTISTIAGGNIGDGELAINASLNFPTSVFVSNSGAILIADYEFSRIREIDSSGIITTIAGNEFSRYYDDGILATETAISSPPYVIANASGEIIFSDRYQNRIRKIDRWGKISTIVGGGNLDEDRIDATSVSLGSPWSIFLDHEGNLFIAETQRHRVRKVDPSGIISTVAGNGDPGFSGDGGLATEASLNYPISVCVDNDGSIFVADRNNNRIRKIASSGIISTVAGDGNAGFSGDGGLATEARFNWPFGILVDADGNLFIADRGNNRVRKVAPSGIITSVVGDGNAGFSGDGELATNARLYSPSGLFQDSSENLYIADSGNNRIRKVDSSGIINTIAGGSIGDGGLATQSTLFGPQGVAVDKDGSIYIADRNDNRIRKIDPSGIISTVAGTGKSGFSGDGELAIDADLNLPNKVFVDNDGNLYISEQGNDRIRKIDRSGIITTVAGGGESLDEGIPSYKAKLDGPLGVFVDDSGLIYIADSDHNKIRKVDNSGHIFTIAGTGEKGFSGDGDLATEANLNMPHDIFVDRVGNIFIVDSGNQRIRKIDSSGIISTIAGNGQGGMSGDGGLATEASFYWPNGISLDREGNIYIAEASNERIRKIDTSGIISTVAGGGNTWSDGVLATESRLHFAWDVFIDENNDILIAESRRIRKVANETSADPSPLAPTILGTRAKEREIQIFWKQNPELDISHYVIFRSEVSEFIPSVSNLVGTVSYTESYFIDSDLTTGTYYYRIIAVDEAGNESEASNQEAVILYPETGELSEGFEDNDLGQFFLHSDGLDISNGLAFLGYRDSVSIAGSFENDLILSVKIDPSQTLSTDDSGLQIEIRQENNQVIWVMLRPFKGTIESGGASIHYESLSDILVEIHKISRKYSVFVKQDEEPFEFLVGTEPPLSPIQEINLINVSFFSGANPDIYALNDLTISGPEVPSIDNLPPGTPANLVSQFEGNQVNLNWQANTEADFSFYIIYRNTADGFPPSITDSIGVVYSPGTSFSDINPGPGDYFYRIQAVDFSGNRSPPTDQVFATIPQNQERTITSIPTGLQITVDGKDYPTPQTFTWVEGSEHTLSVIPSQGDASTRYVFSSWSDGGEPSHTIAIPSSATTYTANFLTEHYLTVNSEQGAPQGSGWYASGEEASWSVPSPTEEVDGTRYVTSTPTGSVVMDGPQSIDIPWTTQYGLTINSDHGSPVGAGWYATGEEASWSVTSPAEEAGGTRYVTATPTGSVLMDGPQSIDIPWTTQYELIVNSDHGSPVGAGWYATGEEASWSVPSPTEEVDGTRYVTSTLSGTVLMDAPRAIDIPWTAEHYLTIESEYGNLPEAGWYASGSEVSWSVISPIEVIEGTRYVTDSPSGSLVMNAPHTIAIPWEIQHFLKASTAPEEGGTVTFIPPGGWYESGTSVTLDAVNATGFEFNEWSGAVSGTEASQAIIVDSPKAVTAIFKPSTCIMTLPSATVTGDTFTVPLLVDKADGILGADISISYDSSILTALKVETTSYAGSFALASNLDAAGKIRLSLFGTMPLSGSGTVAKITFGVIGDIREVSALTIESVNLNEGAILVDKVNGSILPPPRAEISLPSATVTGDTFTVPLLVDKADGILGADISISYDSSILTALKVETTSYAGSFALASNLDAAGKIRLSLFGTMPLSGSGTVAKITFGVVGDIREVSALTIESVNLNEGAILVDKVNGSILPPPRTEITITAIPDGRIVTIDGTDYPTPQTFTWVEGSEHTLSAIPSQGDVSTRYVFSSWGDGGEPSHTIAIPSSVTTYTANFLTEHYLTVNSDHGTPVGAGWYVSGEEASWSVPSPTEEVDGTRYVTSTPTGSVVMDGPQSIDIPWTTQYGLTINSDHGSPVGAGWYATGEEASWSVTSPAEEAGGTRYVTATPTGSVVMDAPQMIDIPWTAQYELTINLDHGTPVGAGWYAAGEEVPWSVTSPVAEAEGVQRVASPGSGSVVMDSPKTVEVSWTVEYLLTVVSARGDPQGSGWYASGSEATWSVTTPVVEEDGTQYIAESSSGTVVMDGAQRVEVEWTIPPPVAGFQAAPLSGQVSLHVQFTDQSTGTITSWAWDFGDGGKSNEPNPFHTYEQPGAYTVTLMVVGPGGTHTYTPPNPISVSKRCDDTCYGCGTVSECGRYCGPCPPHADFEGTPREGRPPLGVQFTDKSSNADSWAWDFGDSGKSNEPNPFHTYSQQGLYTVSLTANGPGGSDSETKLSYIDTRILLPEAVFSAEQEIGEAPLTVTLANASQNAISYLWTLPPDNRQTSQETPDPFTLDEPGIYPIELQVDGRWNTKDDARISIEVIQARFIRSPDPAKINEVITFTDASIGNFTSWKWDFGDGSGSEETDPVHAYTASGVFTVTLTAGRDEHTSTAQEKITILEPPQADFTVSNVEITAGETVAFTDASTGEIASWTWDFGDEKTSKEPNPTHIYDKSGTYTVTLTVSGPGGTDIEEKENLIQAVNSPPVISPPIADQVEDEDTAIALDLTAHETDAQDPGEGLRWGVVILRGAELLETPKADGGMEDLFTFQPKPNLFGEAQVQFTLTDSEGATDTQEVLLTWEATPDPPSVSNLAPESGATNRPTSLKLSWKGDDPDFGDASSLSYDIRLGQTTPRDVLVARDYKNTSIVIDDLQAGSRYFWQITAQDPSGLTGTGPAWTFTTVADTRSPAILTGPDVSGCTDHSATVRWSTDEKCDSFIEFSLQPDMEGAQSLNLPDQVTSHSVFLADLDPETVYYYRIRSTDTSGNSSVFKEGQFETLDGPDVTPPWIITGPVVSAVSDRSAQVEWETDEDADARIRFGVDNLSKDVSVSELRKIHRILLTDLSSTSTYQYQITATDASGNPTTSARFDFTTLATPDITPPTFTSGPVVTSSLHDQATVEWTTDEASNSQVAFGLADTYGEWVTSDDLVQIHRAKLTHLEPATTYHYQVLSTDVNGNGPLTSDDFTFTTLAVPDRTPPQITAAPMLLERTDRSALISWKTNELADSFVEFGLDTDYGFLAGSGEDVLVHRVKLTNLEPARTYHYRVRSTDPGDNGPTFNRGDLTFRTRATPDELPPLIVSDPFVIASTPTTVTVQWVTDEPSDSRIRYGLDDAYGEEKVLPEDVVVHTIDLSNLSSATQYHFQVESTDASNNGPTFSEDRAFTTPSEPDEDPPQLLSGPTVRNLTATSASVEWITDEPATSILDYGTNRSYELGHIERGERVEVHVVSIAHLEPSTTYHFKVSSTDGSGNSFTTDLRGNKQHSRDHNFHTLREADRHPPVFLEGPIVYPRDEGATVEWLTDESTDYEIVFDTVPTFDSFQREVVQSNDRRERHAAELTRLRKGTAYYYRLTVRDQEGNARVATTSGGGVPVGKTAAKPTQSAGSFVTLEEPDTQKPVILSSPTVTAQTASSLTIEWETDERSDSILRFGASPDELNHMAGSPRDVLQHRVVLTNLLPGQACYYIASSTDPSGNRPAESVVAVSSTDIEVDLTPPRLLEEPQCIQATDSQAIIEWATDELSTSLVEFGADGDLVSRRENPELTRLNRITLTNLEAKTVYEYRASSVDGSNNGPTQSRRLTFQTAPGPDQTRPEIVGDPEVMSRSDQTAMLFWATDELADSFVEFGTDETHLEQWTGMAEDVLEHRITLTNLEPATMYFYRVGSVDRSNNGPTRSAVFAFITESMSDTVPPAVPSGVSVEAGSESTWLTWNANKEPDFAGYNLYRRPAVVGEEFQLMASLLQEPSFLDKGLRNGIPYDYQLTAMDNALSPNKSTPSVIVTGTPLQQNVPETPIPLHALVGTNSGMLTIRNADPVTGREVLTYTFQVSTRGDFSDVVASEGRVPEGSEENTTWDFSRILERGEILWWRARAHDGVFSGAWMVPTRFEVKGLIGDFDGNGRVNFDDFFEFADRFGTDTSSPGWDSIFDLRADDRVDFDDFFIFADRFGTEEEAFKRVVLEGASIESEIRPILRVIRITPETVVLGLKIGAVEKLRGYGLVLRHALEIDIQPAILDGRLRTTEEGEVLEGILHKEPGRTWYAAYGLSGKLPGTAEHVFERTFDLSPEALGSEIVLEDLWMIDTDRRRYRVVNGAHVQLIPRAYNLTLPYPNPFNPTVQFSYQLPEKAEVRLQVYNILGQKIRTLVNEWQKPGVYPVIWGGVDDQGIEGASGMYFIRLEAGSFLAIRKVLLLR